jgi:outer membrane receptor for ferrienterochelin and colicins
VLGCARSCSNVVRLVLWLGALWFAPPQLAFAFDDATGAAGNTLIAPKPIASAAPSYPEAALEQTPPPAGTVRVRLSLNERGEVMEVEPVSSPAEVLTQAALTAARALRFEPATRAGQPVAARILYEFAFQPPAPPAQQPSAAAADGQERAAGVEEQAPVLIEPAANSRKGTLEFQAVDVVVTGSRTPEELNQAVVFTDVIGRKTIRETGARDAGEALEHMPSLQLTRSFRGTEIWLRGLDPEYTLVLLDGDRMIGRSGGAVDLTRIGVERIDRIEIVRGPASALYGSDALAGVVNIIAQPSSGQAHGRGLLSGGFMPSAGSPMFDATTWATQPIAKGLDVQASAGLHAAPSVVDEEGSDVTGLSSRTQWSLLTAARYQPHQAHDIKVSGEYDRQRLQGVDEGAGNALYDRTQLREQGSVALSYRMRPSETIDWNTRYRGSFFREQYARDQRGSSAMDSVEDNRERLHQITSMLTWQPEAANATTVGVEQQLQHLRAPRITRSTERSVTSVFAQHRWKPWSREHPERVECDQQLSVVPGARLDVDSQFGHQVSPKLALRYDPVPCMTLRAAYGRGFRAPSFQQLFLRFENPTVGYIVTGNPNLGAERSHGFDLSASYTPAPGMSAFVAVFRNDLRDMIASVTERENAAETLFTYANVARAWTMGIEVNTHVEPVKWLSCDLSYTFTNGWNAQLDRPLEGVARHRPTAMLRFHHDAWGTSARVRGSILLGRIYYGDAEELATTVAAEAASERRVDAPALATGDVRIEQSLGKNVEVFVGIDNIFDAADTYTTLRPRTFYAGLSGHY